MDKNEKLRAKYEELLRVVGEIAEPTIIIWGPGPHKQDYEKRERIRAAIKEAVPSGDVSFPEEIADIFPDNLDANELIQALAADIVIALDISTSAGEEVARYSVYAKIAPKLFVVASNDRKAGYQHAIRKNLDVHFVSSEELLTCQKTTELCLNHVTVWCLQKYAHKA